jgi:hypothetical protein
MADESWYETYNGRSLEQGDVLPACEVLHWQSSTTEVGGYIDTEAIATDVVVITQSCDLENVGKTEFVLLAQVLDYSALLATGTDGKYGKGFRSQCSRGRLPKLALLPPFEGSPSIGWSIVDFSHLYTLPKSVVEDHAASLGARLRMRSPYKEHLSQRFGYYFMRVGLPKGLADFDDYDPTKLSL